MSKATYHVPQPGEVIEFSEKENSAMRHIKQVAAWDSKHSTLTTSGGERYRIENRASIKPAEPVKEHPAIEPERHWDDSVGDPVAVAAAFTARLPTSFASEVERAQAIADAEAEEKKRRSAAIDELKRQSDEIRVLLNKQHDALVVEDDAREDYQSRVNYLRSLRVRGE